MAENIIFGKSSTVINFIKPGIYSLFIKLPFSLPDFATYLGSHVFLKLMKRILSCRPIKQTVNAQCAALDYPRFGDRTAGRFDFLSI